MHVPLLLSMPRAHRASSGRPTGYCRPRRQIPSSSPPDPLRPCRIPPFPRHSSEISPPPGELCIVSDSGLCSTAVPSSTSHCQLTSRARALLWRGLPSANLPCSYSSAAPGPPPSARRLVSSGRPGYKSDCLGSGSQRPDPPPLGLPYSRF